MMYYEHCLAIQAGTEVEYEDDTAPPLTMPGVVKKDGKRIYSK